MDSNRTVKGLSVVIITKNEERNIGRAIDSVREIADEIIVVDSFSDDGTEAICLERGVRFEKREWEGYSATKNYANSLAHYDFIFSLDADEAVSQELLASINKAKEEGLKGTYSMNRLTNYCGSWIKHSGWYPDEKLRIFPKEGTTWEGAYVHEELTFKSLLTNTHLRGDLEHYSYYSQVEHRERADKYSLLTAEKMHAAGKTAGPLKPFLSALARFISMYFFKLGFLDGAAGWRIAVISAQSNILKYKELRRLAAR